MNLKDIKISFYKKINCEELSALSMKFESIFQLKYFENIKKNIKKIGIGGDSGYSIFLTGNY
jgi:hypothetical protein